MNLDHLIEIIPMKIGHIIHGRPWKFNHNTFHASHSNKISFHFQDHKFILCHLTPTTVQEDEIKLKT